LLWAIIVALYNHKPSLYRPMNALKNPSDVTEAMSATCLGPFRPAGIAPFQLAYLPLFGKQGSSDIVEQHCKAIATEIGFKEKNLPSNVSCRCAEMPYTV
jgi:hypothetical protein